MGDVSTGQPARSFSFPDWTRKLQADLSLTAGLRESYRRTILGFLQLCWQRQTGSTVALAREYVDLARLVSTTGSHCPGATLRCGG